MKAAVCAAYGGPDVVRVLEIPAPVAKPNEVLIRVRATTVATGDARVRGSRFPSGFWLPARLFLGLTRPRKPILGTELAGVVQAVGSNVTRYRAGDKVFAFSGAGMGCHAELKSMPEDGAIALMPAGFTFRGGRRDFVRRYDGALFSARCRPRATRRTAPGQRCFRRRRDGCRAVGQTLRSACYRRLLGRQC